MALGRKTGGRTKGTRNKRTSERAARIAEAVGAGPMLARDLLQRAMLRFWALSEKHKRHEPTHVKYLKIAADLAADLCPYESPKLQPTALQPIAKTEGPGVRRIMIEFVKPRPGRFDVDDQGEPLHRPPGEPVN